MEITYFFKFLRKYQSLPLKSNFQMNTFQKAQPNNDPIKPKKDKNSLHNLPKFDKTQLFFNSPHIPAPISFKPLKPIIDSNISSKPYFMNNNLKRGVGNTKVKISKDQNKSITNFLDLTQKDCKNPTETSTKAKTDELKDSLSDSRSGESKFSKLHIKHKNSYGNSLTLEKNFIANNNFRPSLYESSTSKNKEFFHQTVCNRKLQKPEEKKQDLEIILTEASESNNTNEFSITEFKKPILTVMKNDVLFGSSNSGIGVKKDRIYMEKKEEDSTLNFIVKNQDTGTFLISVNALLFIIFDMVSFFNFGVFYLII